MSVLREMFVRDRLKRAQESRGSRQYASNLYKPSRPWTHPESRYQAAGFRPLSKFAIARASQNRLSDFGIGSRNQPHNFSIFFTQVKTHVRNSWSLSKITFSKVLKVYSHTLIWCSYVCSSAEVATNRSMDCKNLVLGDGLWTPQLADGSCSHLLRKAYTASKLIVAWRSRSNPQPWLALALLIPHS